MRVYRHYDEFESEPVAAVVTVGNFDGVHLGHRRILAELLDAARRIEARSVLMTFEPHPTAVLNPKAAPALLTTQAMKERLLKAAGVEALLVQPFDASFASLLPEEFVEQVLIERIGAKAVIVGSDFVFGKDGKGDLGLLAEMGLRLGFDTLGVEPVAWTDRPISSTWIRDCLRQGDVETAARLLDRPYEIEGAVEKGSGRGAGLGYPTANLGGIQTMVPASGIYAARVEIEGRTQPAVVYIGDRPTFADTRSIEVHLLGASMSLYGLPLTVRFVSRIREDRKFDSPAALKAQIAVDIAAARNILGPDAARGFSHGQT